MVNGVQNLCNPSIHNFQSAHNLEPVWVPITTFHR